MDLYEVESDGKKYIFNVVKNTTEPCPQCGAPACGREDILWYEVNDQRYAYIFDGGFFDMARDEFLKQNNNEIKFDNFPEFIKQWIELKGWEDCWDYEGYEIDIEDFSRSMELLRACQMGEWITKDEIDDMQGLANEAKEKGVRLMIVRG